MSRRRILIVALVLASVALVARRNHASWSVRRVALTPAAEAGGDFDRSTAPARLARGVGRAWPLGLQYVYEVALDQTLQVGAPPPGASGAAPTVRLAFAGQATATVVDQADGAVAVEYQLAPSRLELVAGDGRAADPGVVAATLAGLRQPFFVTQEASGAVVALHVEPAVDPMAQLVIRNLIDASQIVLPRGALAHWTVTERDQTGAYAAAYRRAAGGEVEKRRGDYAQVSGPAGLEPLAEGVRIEPRGATRFDLDPRRWVSSLTAQVGLRVTADGVVMGDGELSLTLRALRHGWAHERVGRFHAERARLVVVTAGRAPRDLGETQRLRQVLGGADLASLFADLRGLPADPAARGPAAALALQRLRALFLLDPAQAAAVPALIGAVTERDVYSPILGALSAAGNPEAARALTQISADEALPQAVRVDAIAALGVVGQPDVASLETLEGLAASTDPELRSTAALAVGTTAGTLVGRGDPAGDQALARLLTQSASAADDAERALVLAALANTRSPSILSAVEAALTSPSIEVRQAAVTALRLIADPRADQLIGWVMAEDPAPEVRRAAIFAVRFRAPEPLVPALTAALTADTVDVVRLDVVRLLGEHRGRLREARDLLTVASQRDPSPEVRRVAAAFVAAAG